MPVTIQEIRFGVEIETVGRTRRVVAEAIRTVVGGTVEHVGTPTCYDPYHVTDARGLEWKVVADSSLTNVPADQRAEIVSPILSYDDIPLLQEMVRAVKQAGARCDERCGLHLHLSHPSVTPKALANLAKTIYKQEELIYAALGVTQERIKLILTRRNICELEHGIRFSEKGLKNDYNYHQGGNPYQQDNGFYLFTQLTYLLYPGLGHEPDDGGT